MTSLATKNLSDSEQGQEIVSSIGMIVALVSFAMLFATLMLGFAMFRITAPVWPPAGMVRPSLLIPAISTIFLLLSSVSYIWFEKDIANKKALLITTALGLAFMFMQSAFWYQLKAQGIFASSGIFPSIIYAFTWIHAAHVVAGLGLLLWLIFFGLKNTNTKTLLHVSSVGKFWHFLGIVWIIMFLTIFVL